MRLLHAGRRRQPPLRIAWPIDRDGDSDLSVSLVADAGERVFAAGLAVLIAVDLVVRSFDVSLPAKLQVAGQNLLAALVVVGIAAGVARGRWAEEGGDIRWWHALPLLVPVLAIALQAEVPPVYRVAVLIGTAAFVGGLFWGRTRPQEEQGSWREASRRHLAITALAVATVLLLHELERIPPLAAVQIAAGGYLILFAPGIQMTYVLVPRALALERVAWGVALSMAVVPMTLMWLIWLGVPPTREVIVGMAVALTVAAACLVHLLPDKVTQQRS